MRKKSGGNNNNYTIDGPNGVSDFNITIGNTQYPRSPMPPNTNFTTSAFAANAELITGSSQQTGAGSLSKKYKLIGKLLNNLSNKYKKNEKTNLKTEINKLKL